MSIFLLRHIRTQRNIPFLINQSLFFLNTYQKLIGNVLRDPGMRTLEKSCIFKTLQCQKWPLQWTGLLACLFACLLYTMITLNGLQLRIIEWRLVLSISLVGLVNFLLEKLIYRMVSAGCLFGLLAGLLACLLVEHKCRRSASIFACFISCYENKT